MTEAPQTYEPDTRPLDVERECARRVAQAFGGRDLSLLREAAALTAIVSSGGALTDEQQAAADILSACNAWEAAMIDAREEAIAARTPLAAIAWPAPPAALTPGWLRGF